MHRRSLKKKKRLNSTYRTNTKKSQESITKHLNSGDLSMEAHRSSTQTVIDPSELDSAELQTYCNENVDKCNEDSFWSMLLEQNFPDISLMIIDLEFPDLEKEIRSSRRKFLPLRELYSQLLVITSNPSQLTILDKVINNESINDKSDIDKDFIRFYLQLLSFLMATKSNDWKNYLVVVNDPLLEYIPVSIEELEQEYFYLKASHLTKIYLSLSNSNPAANDNYAIRYASEKGYTEVVKLLIAYPGVDPTVHRNHAIQIASGEGHTEVVKALLEDPRVDPTAGSNYALHLASWGGHTEIVKLLLAWKGAKGLQKGKRVDPAANENFAIRQAARKGHTEVVKLLLAYPGVDPTAENNHAIQVASIAGHTEVVKLLLGYPDVNPAAYMNYAIREAAYYGHTEVVKLLLADPRVDPTAYNNHAIEWAAKNEHSEVVRLLLENERVQASISQEQRDIIDYLGFNLK